MDSTLEDIISQGENGSLRLCPMASWSLCLWNMRNDCSEKGSINSHWFANAGITADTYHHRQQVASGCICWCSTPAPQKPEPGRRCARGEGAVKCRECLAEESQWAVRQDSKICYRDGISEQMAFSSCMWNSTESHIGYWAASFIDIHTT